MEEPASIKQSFFYAVLLHIILLSFLIVSFDVSATHITWQNADDHHVIINATVLTLPHMVKQPVSSFKKASPPTKKIDHIIPVIKQKIREPAIALSVKKVKPLQQSLAQKQRKQELKQAQLQRDFAEELKKINAKALEQQVLNEQKKLQEAKEAAMRGEVNKYKALILESIAEHWLVPSNTNKKLFADLLIRLAPGGAVLDVQLIKSSGVDALDRSARAAVFKASPLPVPKDSTAFDSFRQFVLRVKPENILENDMG